MIGICFLATIAYENAYQFVYSTSDSIVVQANKLLEQHLNQSFACANAEIARITGTTNLTGRADQARETLGASGFGSSLVQPLSIDQFMAYDEYWVPDKDAPWVLLQVQEILYNFTIDAIYGCLGQSEVSILLFSLCAFRANGRFTHSH